MTDLKKIKSKRSNAVYKYKVYKRNKLNASDLKYMHPFFNSFHADFCIQLPSTSKHLWQDKSEIRLSSLTTQKSMERK